jgi:cell division protein FtsI (penicillin-binding protein 3)
VIDAPHSGGNTGGVVAAPIFKRIAEATLRYMGVSPTISPAPPVLVARGPEPAPVSTPISAGDPAAVHVIVDLAPGTMPDLRGMSARDAIRILAELGLSPTMQGDGFVMSQSPEPGAPIQDRPECRLLLGREPARQAAGSAQP